MTAIDCPLCTAHHSRLEACANVSYRTDCPACGKSFHVFASVGSVRVGETAADRKLNGTKPILATLPLSELRAYVAQRDSTVRGYIATLQAGLDRDRATLNRRNLDAAERLVEQQAEAKRERDAADRVRKSEQAKAANAARDRVSGKATRNGKGVDADAYRSTLLSMLEMSVRCGVIKLDTAIELRKGVNTMQGLYAIADACGLPRL